ncbi:MAG: porin [Janthinobacterium lividum]
MNKLLLRTTALVMSLPLLTLPVIAAVKPAKELTPSIKLSGETSFNMHGFKQDKTRENRGKGYGQHMEVADSRVNVEIFQKLENYGGLECSGLIGLSGNASNGNVQENRIKLKGEWGTLIFGNTRGPDDFAAVGGFAIMGATGGFAGNFTSTINQTTGAVITTDLAGRPKDATKAIYVTPRIGGLQGVIGITTDTTQKGDRKLESRNPGDAKSLPFDRNQLNLGVNFKETFNNGLDFKVSATALSGNTRNPVSATTATVPMSHHKTKSYALGIQLGYRNFEFGAEYINNGKSQVSKYRYALDASGNNATFVPVTGADAGRAYDVAVGYAVNKKDKVSLGYYNSTRKIQSGYKKSKANIYSATWDHKLGPGLGVYLEGNVVDMKNDNQTVKDQNDYKLAAGKAGLSSNDLADGVGNNTMKGAIAGIKLKF